MGSHAFFLSICLTTQVTHADSRKSSITKICNQDPNENPLWLYPDPVCLFVVTVWKLFLADDGYFNNFLWDIRATSELLLWKQACLVSLHTSLCTMGSISMATELLEGQLLRQGVGKILNFIDISKFPSFPYLHFVLTSSEKVQLDNFKKYLLIFGVVRHPVNIQLHAVQGPGHNTVLYRLCPLLKSQLCLLRLRVHLSFPTPSVTRKGLGGTVRVSTGCIFNVAVGFTAALTSGEASHPVERPVPTLSSPLITAIPDRVSFHLYSTLC